MYVAANKLDIGFVRWIVTGARNINLIADYASAGAQIKSFLSHSCNVKNLLIFLL